MPVASDAYFVWLIAYIHRNPQKHGLVGDFGDWPYSSYHTFLSGL
jgi:putative transposase